MDKKDNYIRIPREKLSFYHKIKVDKETRKLIKIVNGLQKWAQTERKRK